MTASRVALAAVGDVNDIRTWSGIPYHFLKYAQAAGLIQEGLPLDTELPVWKRRRLLWNLGSMLMGRGKGGYQYSTSFLEQLWQPVKNQLLDQTVINCFQLYAPSVVAEQRIRKMFYIDMTLLQLFDLYGIRDTIGSAIAAEALEREREGYHASEVVVGHSQWAAQSVIDDYGVDADKVRAIVPGANIDRDAYYRWHRQATIRQRSPGDPLRLIFVGKYWQRKGLDRLLEALLVVHGQGKKIHLTVIGCKREELPVALQNVPDVEWLGFIDKKHDPLKFLNLVAQSDIGCLLSRAEAGGMVLREYHALGLVTLGTTAGGSPEHMIADAGFAVPLDATAENIAQWLTGLVEDPARWEQLRQCAWERRLDATWDTTVKQWSSILK